MTIETITKDQIWELRNLPIFSECSTLTERLFPTEYVEVCKVQEQITNLADARDAEIKQTEIKYRRTGIQTNKKAADEIRKLYQNTPTLELNLIGHQGILSDHKEYTSGTATPMIKNTSALSPANLQQKMDAITAKYDPKIEELCEQREIAEKPILEMYNLMAKVDHQYWSNVPITVTKTEIDKIRELNDKLVGKVRTIVVLR